MKKFIFLLCIFGLLSSLSAQRFTYLTNGPVRENVPFISAELFSFYVVPLQQDNFPENVRLRWIDGQGNYSEWHDFKQDDHADAGRFVSELGIAEKARWTNFELEMPASGPVYLYIYDPGRSTNAATSLATPLESVACFQPAVMGREDWCPSGNCPKDLTPSFTTVTHLIVHHSAGVNQASDWSSVVRIIWDFHVNGNGWDDVGYNYLVDPNGVIYEGRGNNVQGAHYCGKNGNTMGTCLLGDFTSIMPTDDALESLAKLQAWKAADVGIDPGAITFHAGGQENQIGLAGHRDGCNTSCPGDSFYSAFGLFRQLVVSELENCTLSSTEAVPAWAQAIIVSPNPGNGAVRIQGVPATAYLSLFDLKGRLLLQEEGGKVTNVEAMLSDAAAGVYLLRIEANGATISRRIIRE